MNAISTLPRALALAISTALVIGCGKSDNAGAAKPAVAAEARPAAASAAAPTQAVTPAPTPAAAAPNEDALVAEIAASLQACSYDGKPVKLGKQQRSDAPAPGDCRNMVARIMQFTGLPQNFDVVEGPVDNAAAVILLDKQKLP